MKVLILVVGLFLPTLVAAAEAPFALSARIESVWSKLEFPEERGTKQYDGDFQLSAIPSFELRDDIYLIGRVSYPVRSKLTEFAVGLEFAIYR